jgi:hypothetical protein
MISPPGTQSQPLSSSASSGRIRRWLVLASGAWIVCALLLANFVASIPAYYKLLLTVCTLPNHVLCTNPGQGTPSCVSLLAQMQAMIPEVERKEEVHEEHLRDPMGSRPSLDLW